MNSVSAFKGLNNVTDPLSQDVFGLAQVGNVDGTQIASNPAH